MTTANLGTILVNTDGSGIASLAAVTQLVLPASQQPGFTLVPDFSLGTHIYCQTDHDLTLGDAINYPPDGQRVKVTLKQDATGNRKLVFGLKWQGIAAVTNKKGPNQPSSFEFLSNGDGTFYLESFSAIDLKFPIDIRDYGAPGGTQVNPNGQDVFIQRILDDGYNALIPANYSAYINKPLRLTKNNQKIFGMDRATSAIRPGAGFAGGMVVFYPTYTKGGLPTTTALLTGTGVAGLFNGTSDYWLEMADCDNMNMNGFSTLSWDETFKMTGATPGNGIIIACSGHRESGTSGTWFQVATSGVSGGHYGVSGNMQTTGGFYAWNFGAFSFTQGTKYHLAVTYDGTNIRAFVNGVLEQTVAATGTFIQPDYATWMIGNAGNDINGGGGGSASPICAMDSIRLSRNCRWTGNFTAPTAKWTFDPHTIFLHNFDNEQGVFSVASVISFPLDGQFGMPYWLLVARNDGLEFVGGCGLSNLTITNNQFCSSIGVRWATDCFFEKLTLGGSFYVKDNSFGLTMKDITMSLQGDYVGTRIGMLIGNACGTFKIDNLRITGARYELVVYNSGGRIDTYVASFNTETKTGLYILSAGDNAVDVSNYIIDDEATGDAHPECGALIQGTDAVAFHGGNLDVSTFLEPAFKVANCGVISLHGTAVRMHANAQEVFNNDDTVAGVTHSTVATFGAVRTGAASAAPWTSSTDPDFHMYNYP